MKDALEIETIIYNYIKQHNWNHIGLILNIISVSVLLMLVCYIKLLICTLVQLHLAHLPVWQIQSKLTSAFTQPADLNYTAGPNHSSALPLHWLQPVTFLLVY